MFEEGSVLREMVAVTVLSVAAFFLILVFFGW
jgi:hypothetical protein